MDKGEKDGGREGIEQVLYLRLAPQSITLSL